MTCAPLVMVEACPPIHQLKNLQPTLHMQLQLYYCPHTIQLNPISQHVCPTESTEPTDILFTFNRHKLKYLH